MQEGKRGEQKKVEAQVRLRESEVCLFVGDSNLLMGFSTVNSSLHFTSHTVVRLQAVRHELVSTVSIIYSMALSSRFVYSSSIDAL